MRPNLILLLLSCCAFSILQAQNRTIKGKVVNSKLEPLAFASLEIKELKYGAVTKEDGSYEIKLEEGKYDVVISMVGYRSQIFTLIVNKDIEQQFILEEDNASNLSEVLIKGKIKDRAEEIIRAVIKNKESINAANRNYSCKVYIKAIQFDSTASRSKKQKIDTAINSDQRELAGMSMAEITLDFDHNESQQVKEQRTGISKRGDPGSLYYLSLTEGDFNLYNSHIKAPVLSQIPFISPISYSGLIAYRFKTIKTIQLGKHKIYHISIRPRQWSNATIEGEIIISDSSLTIQQAKFRLPKYHVPEYDYFEIEQQYDLLNDSSSIITRQVFTYYSKTGKGKRSGQTNVYYKDFELDKVFPKRYFGNEVSVTTDSAYKKDSTYWQQKRIEPLTEREVKFIRYKDSVYFATHTKAYLDSLDRVINKTNWKKILFLGQTLNNHEKRKTWILPSLISLYQPIMFGGTRINPSVLYYQTFESRKNLSIFANISYGIRNKDINGSININRMYNPFNRGFYSISIGREFQYIFQGDAWINLLKRSNTYLNNSVGIGHGLELANGLFLYNNFDIAFRRSVSGYKTNPLSDSLLGSILINNRAIPFEPYNAVYGKVKLAYTFQQRYIREPKEKIILGSKWPTAYVLWRKGIPGIMNSQVNFDYLEFGFEQQLRLGTFGISNYNIKTGSFPNTKDLRLVDYQFQRQGDPILFLNPNEAFQALDSTFPVFKRFYQAHYVHEFNGLFLNKLPLLKKLQLREVAGGGFLIAPERNLRYIEMFTGVERVFKWPFNPLTKFKLGVYVVGSAANKFSNPIQFKIGITQWDRMRNKWF